MVPFSWNPYRTRLPVGDVQSLCSNAPTPLFSDGLLNPAFDYWTHFSSYSAAITRTLALAKDIKPRSLQVFAPHILKETCSE